MDNRTVRYLHTGLIRIALIAAACLVGMPNAHSQILTKDDLQKELATYQAISLKTTTANMTAVQAGQIWSRLGACIRMQACMARQRTPLDGLCSY